MSLGAIKISLPLIVVVWFSLLRPISAEEKKGKPLNERATAAAWMALEAEKFESAIKSADDCIGEFRGAAKRAQEKLEKEKAVIPANPTTEEQKQKIFENGLLNDVATCYFIKGRAAEKLGRKEDAKKAYEEARRLTYARTWDARGWFWSPAEGAADRLDALR